MGSSKKQDLTPKLLAFAKSLGIGDQKVLEAGRIVVEERFRSLCAEPRCPNYNTSINCPPHSMTPAQFQELIKGFTLVLAFKLDFPMEAVQGTERREATLLLHETTAAIEHHARSLGFERARGYSSGACKRTFCSEHADCAALQNGGRCRHSDKARPSLSGMGVNWHELSRILDWVMHKNEKGSQIQKAETIMMAGLVFLE
ncbi:MAG: DUF2284 domain-containing protein [Thermodesulfobacteriota bacterium]